MIHWILKYSKLLISNNRITLTSFLNYHAKKFKQTLISHFNFSLVKITRQTKIRSEQALRRST